MKNGGESLKSAVIITGSSGAIGQHLVAKLMAHNYCVIGLDITPCIHTPPSHFINVDLGKLVFDSSYYQEVISDIQSIIKHKRLELLLNNAATQILVEPNPHGADDFMTSQAINAGAPLVLYRGLFSRLKTDGGTVVNIGSIHSRLTKPGFAVYAASKAALRSLTESLAIENKGAVRIFSIEPAAVDTPMLREGLKDPANLKKLEEHHPAGIISSAKELADFVFLLFSSDTKFLHGSCVDFSGGISNRLHDPY